MYKNGFVVAVLFLMAGCGGGGGGGGNNNLLSNPYPGIESGPNVLSVVVDTGPTGATPNINLPFVTVTICEPGTSSCQTIDHVLLDTGSYGLRILASQLNPLLNLPAQTDGGSALAECAVFFGGYMWGGVKLADVTLGSETASSVPIQIVGDSLFPVTPNNCVSQAAVPIDSVGGTNGLGANGILGVGPLRYDCGSWCVSNANNNTYYAFPSSATSVSVALSNVGKEVTNPVAMLPTDNNGIVIYFPAVPAGGAATVTGAMALGIGTQSNNALGAATVFDVDSSGNFRTTYNSVTLTAFFDTGSNGLFFPDSITRCTSNPSDWYCPSSTLNPSAVISGATNGASKSVSFSVANLDTLRLSAPTYVAFGNVGGYLAGYFDWGLPFHYGRKVFTAIEGRSTPAGTGPYVAF